MYDGNQYTFTITLRPKMYKLPAEHQYDRTAEQLYEFLRLQQRHPLRVSYVAEVTKSMNIHFHGVAQFADSKNLLQAKKWFADKFRNDPIFGYIVRVDLITNHQGWLEYITKSLKQTQELINRQPIIADDLNIFKHGMENFVIVI